MDGGLRVARAPRDADCSSDQARLDDAVGRLERLDPHCSARTGLSRRQISFLGLLLLAVGWCFWCYPHAVWQCGEAFLALAFATFLSIRLLALQHLVGRKPMPVAQLASLEPLPVYTVIVALHDEAKVVAQLVEALRGLDYPPAALDIIFALEAHDAPTADALEACGLPGHMGIVIVPPGLPRTKPRALCYALTFARGDYVVVYDAEDAPDPGQLRAAVTAFRTGDASLGCVQARLTIADRPHDALAMQFAIEYAALFDAILPALTKRGLPVLLGGTSNHFPRHVLEDVGGWDPYNVTEDADLGIRLARAGWQVDVLDSATLEDAPDSWRFWFAPRTRWQKGWLQTYFVHMRQPVRLWRELGPRGFAAFQIVLGGGLLCAFVHPLFYGWLFWNIGHGTLAPPTGPAAWVWWMATANIATAFAVSIIVAHLAIRRRRTGTLGRHALVSPLYWLPISLALYRAIWEWNTFPHYWAKTPHRPRSGR
jgi:glycosyltransferase XagB